MLICYPYFVYKFIENDDVMIRAQMQTKRLFRI